MSIFTVIDGDGKKQTYEGIKQYMPLHKLVAVAWAGEVLEVWGLDNPEALEELKRYYRSERGSVPTLVVYDKVGQWKES